MLRFLQKCFAYVDKTNRWLGEKISYLLFAIIAITCYEVIARYFFRAPTIWAWDINIQIFAFIVTLSAGWLLLEDAHIGIDVVVARMSKRTRLYIEVLTYLLFFLSTGVMLWYGGRLAWDSLLAGERISTILAPPYYTLKSFVFLGALLLFLQGLSNIHKKLVQFKE